ncbi:Aste57867_10611 [Aphanomyces stellatus]|uniref:Aste57867_10611 protein n=1 Tax=Aphanomyces stellatus TaxID=120398 RepID=A0A485KR93_9STRA|nr:hypothetical protein As57867_010571 [Aphanomyces stellatus]VFT87483.1 Aste57867_10611 [Aphanomyces stellatus]
MPHQLLDIVARAATSTDIFSLADISSVRNWDYSLPTLTKDKRFTERKPWTSSSSFKTAFDERYPILKEIKLDHLALMGGAVLSLLTDAFTSKDLDFFVVTDQPTLSDEAAATFSHDRVKQFIHDVYTFMSTSNDELKKLQEEKQKTKPAFKIDAKKFYQLELFRVRRVLNVYTVDVPTLRAEDWSASEILSVQLITSPYATLPDLVRHADLSITGIAYFNGNVHFTELSKFSFENLCFVVDGATFSSTYVDRVIKYFDRGFDVLLPYLDVSKVRTHNFAFGVDEVIDLPQLTVVVNDIKGHKVCVTEIKKPKLVDGEASAKESSSKFDGYDRAGASNSMHAGAIIHCNIVSLINGTYDAFIVDGEGANYAKAFRDRPYITERMLINSYETVKNDLYTNSTLNLSKLVKYFTVLKPSALLDRVVGSYVAAKEAEGRAASAMFDKSFDAHVERVVEELVAEQVAIAKLKIVELEKLTLPTKTVESRRGVAPSPEVFFGKYYKAL